MRRAKIQVKPNIGSKVSSGPIAIATPPDVTSSPSANFSEPKPSSINTTSVDQPDKEVCLVNLSSDQPVQQDHSVPIVASSISKELRPAVDGAVTAVASSILPEVDVSDVQRANIELNSGVEVEQTNELTNSESPHGVEHVINDIAPVSSVLPTTKLPARRLKSHWKPNLVKAATSASVVKPSVVPVSIPIIPTADVQNIAENVLSPPAESVATTIAQSPIESIASGTTIAVKSLTTIESVDNPSVQQRTVDGLTSPTSVLRRGKFAAKPNVAKAARVRHLSVGEGCIASASNTGVNVSHSAVLPDTVGELRPALVTVSALDQSTPPKTYEELDSEKAATACSSATELSAEKVAAKMIERKIKQRKKRRQLEQLLGPIDRSTICIRDLIYMNPVNNPMKSPDGSKNFKNAPKKASLETSSDVSVGENRSRSPSVARTVSGGEVSASNTPVPDDNDENYEPIPQVKVGPDGKIILNFDSIVMEEKKSDLGEKLEIIDECNLIRRGYPKKNRCKLWDTKETRKFYLLLSQIGTDFSLMCRLFPDRSRTDIKKKFKREEKIHHELIERALGERKGLDMTLLAEPCSASSSEDESSKVKKVARKRKGANAVTEDTTAEKDPSQPTVQAAKKKRQRVVKPSKKKPKKNLYYDSSSDSDENSSNIAATVTTSTSASIPQPETENLVNDSSAVSVAQPASNNFDEDEVEIIKQICGRPTKSGRLPRPTMKQIDDADALSGGLSKTSPSKRTKTTSPQTTFTTAITSPREFASIVSPRSGIISMASGIASSKSTRMPKTPAPKPPLAPSQAITSFSPSPYLSHMVSPLALNAASGAQSPGMLGINRLPSGVYVVLESPQGSSAGGDNPNGNQQVLYHIFAEMSPAQASPITSPNNGHVAANSASPLIRPLHHTSGQLIRPLHSASPSAHAQRVASPLVHPLHNAGLHAQNAGLFFRPAIGSPIRSPHSSAYAFVEPGAIHQSVSVGGAPHQGTGYFPRSRPFSRRYSSHIQGVNAGLSNPSGTVGSIPDPRYSPVFAYPGVPAVHNVISSAAAMRPVNSPSSTRLTTLTNCSMKSPPQLPISYSPAAKTSHSGAQLHQSTGNSRSINRNASFEDDKLEQSMIATRQQDGTIVIMSEKVHQQHSGEPSRQHSDSQNRSSDGPLIPSTERQQSSLSVDTEEAGSSVATIRVIEHEDGSTELLIDGSLYSMDGIQLDNSAVEDDESQYIDVVVEHYPSNDSNLT